MAGRMLKTALFVENSAAFELGSLFCCLRRDHASSFSAASLRDVFSNCLSSRIWVRL